MTTRGSRTWSSGVLERVAAAAVRRAMLKLGGGRPKLARKLALGIASDVADMLASDESRADAHGTGTVGAAHRHLRLCRAVPDPRSAGDREHLPRGPRVRPPATGGPEPGADPSLDRGRPPASRSPRSHFQAVSARSADSLDSAMAEGRLYILDYAELEGAKTGTTSGAKKYVEAALAMFVVEADSRRFMPVAIQLGPTARARHTHLHNPPTGPTWAQARIHVQAADGVTHETIAHLGLTHLLVGTFKMVSERQLPSAHPGLQPAGPPLRRYDGHQHLCRGPRSSHRAASWTCCWPPRSASRGAWRSRPCWARTSAVRTCRPTSRRAGVADAEALPDYPYRDDGLLIWYAIRQWVEAYLGLYYEDDGAVAADTELQAWRDELESADGGMLRGIGTLATTAELTDLLTFVVFTASAQHAAVNFPQLDIMSVTPVMHAGRLRARTDHRSARQDRRRGGARSPAAPAARVRSAQRHPAAGGGRCTPGWATTTGHQRGAHVRGPAGAGSPGPLPEDAEGHRVHDRPPQPRPHPVHDSCCRPSCPSPSTSEHPEPP